MRPKKFDIDPDNVDTDIVAASQTLATGGGALTLATTSLDYGRQLGVACVGDETGNTFAVVGTDTDGYAQSETVTGVSATTAETTKYYKTVSSITGSAATATGGVSVGTVDELSTQTIPLDWRSDSAAAVNVDVTGTVNFTVQYTFDDIQRPGQSPRSAAQNGQWLDITAFAAKTADTVGTAPLGATALRLIINSYSNGAEIQMNVNQTTSRH
jgi:hypothetical protein